MSQRTLPTLHSLSRENVDSNPEKRRYSEILLQLPDLFGGAEVFDKAEKLFAGTALSDRLTELKETFDALRKLEAEDKITVDLGLVNKAEYYTGIVFRGYIEEYGQAVPRGEDEYAYRQLRSGRYAGCRLCGKRKRYCGG